MQRFNSYANSTRKDLELQKSIRYPKQRFKLILREEENVTTSKNPIDDLIRCLQISTSRRQEKDADTIYTVLSKWPEFTKFITTDQMRREVCWQMIMEEFHSDSIIYKEDDPSDSWYIIISGTVDIIKKWADDENSHQISQTQLSNLKSEFGISTHFKLMETLGSMQSFGNQALISNKKRESTIYVKEPTFVIRIDSQLYKDIFQFCRKVQIHKKVDFFSKVKEFQILSDSDIFNGLAESATEISLNFDETFDATHLIDPNDDNCLYVIIDGIIEKQRLIDFNLWKNRIERDHSNLDALSVRVPKGKRVVKIEQLGQFNLFASPAMKSFVPFDFSLAVIQPVRLYKFLYSDITKLLTKSQIEKIRESLMKEPNELQVIEMWIEKQRAAQWRNYKKCCVKRAKTDVKFERDKTNERIILRKASIPKSFKPYIPLK